MERKGRRSLLANYYGLDGSEDAGMETKQKKGDSVLGSGSALESPVIDSPLELGTYT
jgi:hypothetical protein